MKLPTCQPGRRVRHNLIKSRRGKGRIRPPPKKEPEQLAKPEKLIKIQEEFPHKEEDEKIVFVEDTENSICIQLKSVGNGVVDDWMMDSRQRGSALKNIDDVAAEK
ncbi:MAG: hypothetical protein U9O82_11930 [Thermodesulfobacteriota bacterium]|nr:hypothetical protein [Thermodesulfobacteriota bacterium]